MRKPECGWLARSRSAPGAEHFDDPADEYLGRRWLTIGGPEQGNPEGGLQAWMKKKASHRASGSRTGQWAQQQSCRGGDAASSSAEYEQQQQAEQETGPRETV